MVIIFHLVEEGWWKPLVIHSHYPPPQKRLRKLRADRHHPGIYWQRPVHLLEYSEAVIKNKSLTYRLAHYHGSHFEYCYIVLCNIFDICNNIVIYIRKPMYCVPCPLMGYHCSRLGCLKTQLWPKSRQKFERFNTGLQMFPCKEQSTAPHTTINCKAWNTPVLYPIL